MKTRQGFGPEETRSREDDGRDRDYGTRLDPKDLLAADLAVEDAAPVARRSGELDFGDGAEAAAAGGGALEGRSAASASSSGEDDHDHDHEEEDGVFADHLLHEHGHGDPGDEIGGGAGAEGPLPSIGDHELDELMGTLNRGGASWTNDGSGLVLTFAFPQSVNDFPDDHLAAWDWTSPSAEGLDPFTAFNVPRQSNTVEALRMWESVANVTFVEVDPGEAADIYFFGREYEQGGAYSMGVQEELGSAIRVNTASSTWNAMEVGRSGFTTMMHEIGHTLGLSHPGDYDVGDNATYDTHADYVEDSNMYTIMSYFGAHNTGATYGGWENFSEDTPRGHDIYVAQQLYGANWDTRDGNTTYGFNTTETGSLYDFDALAAINAIIDNTEAATGVDLEERGPVLTIWDGGGADDWLDLSGDGNDVTLDLAPGAFSSTHGMTFNISLAYHPGDGAGQFAHYIENARGGSGDDTIYGNELANELEGGGGHDEIFGLGGADTLRGGAGDDTLNGGYGTDQLHGGGGHDTADYSYSDVDWTIDL
ncbi:MAG: M10 family metallopeptidase C-terminal domain-containing protein, partial [Pseudomonadota bacterium]